MTVETDQKYQETVETDAHMIFQPKQRDDCLEITIILCCINTGHDKLVITYVEEVVNVSSYLLLESVGFDTDISYGVAKMRASTLFGDIIHQHQCTKNTLNYVHKTSKYGHLVSIPAAVTQELFSRSARDKGWVD